MNKIFLFFTVALLVNMLQASTLTDITVPPVQNNMPPPGAAYPHDTDPMTGTDSGLGGTSNQTGAMDTTPYESTGTEIDTEISNNPTPPTPSNPTPLNLPAGNTTY